VDFPDANLRIDAATNRPSPEDIYTELVCAALLIPDLARDVSAEKAVLEKSIGDVDLRALKINDQEQFDRSLGRAQQDLEPLKPTLPRGNISSNRNSHIDAAWLWPWTETVDVVKRTFGPRFS